MKKIEGAITAEDIEDGEVPASNQTQVIHSAILCLRLFEFRQIVTIGRERLFNSFLKPNNCDLLGCTSNQPPLGTFIAFRVMK